MLHLQLWNLCYGQALLLAGLMSLVVSLQPQQVRREISEIENTFKMLVCQGAKTSCEPKQQDL
eukprot:5592470-Amphidinium_carterae.1